MFRENRTATLLQVALVMILAAKPTMAAPQDKPAEQGSAAPAAKPGAAEMEISEFPPGPGLLVYAPAFFPPFGYVSV